MNASTAVQRCLDRRVAGGEPLHMRVFVCRSPGECTPVWRQRAPTDRAWRSDHSYLPRDRCSQGSEVIGVFQDIHPDGVRLPAASDTTPLTTTNASTTAMPARRRGMDAS